MIFSKKAISMAMAQEHLAITPFDQSALEAAHVNLHLDSSSNEIVLAPHKFVVAKTVEKVRLSELLCGSVEGRASLAKQGISIEQSSTFIEPGTDNHLTLEIFNASSDNVILKAGQPIAKLFIMKVVDTI